MSLDELEPPVLLSARTFSRDGWLSIEPKRVCSVCDWLLLAFAMAAELLEPTLEILMSFPLCLGAVVIRSCFPTVNYYRLMNEGILRWGRIYVLAHFMRINQPSQLELTDRWGLLSSRRQNTQGERSMKVLFPAALFALLAIIWCPLVLIPASDSYRNHRGVKEKEMVQSREVLFQSLDANRDNVVTLEEFLADPSYGDRDTAETEFRKMDANQDGKLTLAEFMQR